MSSRIKFIEESHRYMTEDDRELISVSSFMDKFKNKVDWKAIAKRKAAKETKEGNPTTTQDLLDRWERKRDMSAQIGTLYHSIREKGLLENCETKQCTYIGDVKYSIPINELANNTTYAELMIYDLDHMICGQADKVIVEKGKINIWDYKTDVEIKYKAFSSKWVEPQKLLKPLHHLDECNYNIYSIKMSMYMYMLWNANKGRFKTGDLIIEHVQLARDPNNDNIPILRNGQPVVEKIEKIILPYRKKEVEDMLATIKHKV